MASLNGSSGAQSASASGQASPRRVDNFIPLVTVIDFHHARGPEVEGWYGVSMEDAPDWPLLPFMALSDGAHASTEDFSYFTLLRPTTETSSPTSLFGISCTRQIDAAQLLNRPPEVTRSTVQKAVVVIADSPQSFGMLRERLSVVTQAWFSQRDFTDTEILRRFQESLADEKERGVLNDDEDRDSYLGMSLREMVREFRWQALLLLKCCLLQPKMLFFGSRCERLCMMQFSLISLVPGLIRKLQDCADPELDGYEKQLTRPTNLRTSDRASLQAYMGLPLQIFGKGSLFGPYTPLQQLDVLADVGTKSYIVGSTNSLLLQQRDRYSDILINLDDDTINITSTSLRQALQLSVADRRWMDFVTQTVNDTWDDTNPGRPKTMGFMGSEEFIRLQFEDYVSALLSSVKYHNHLLKNGNNPKALLPHIEGDPCHDFNMEWVEAWMRTENYRIWNKNTDDHLFDIVDPKHICAGGLTIDDVQRRLAQQVSDMHLDEKIAQGREAVGRNLQAGKEKASTVLNKIYADMEAFREAQKKKAEEAKLQQEQQQQNAPASPVKSSSHSSYDPNQPTYGEKASTYMSSWASWAGEKRKALANRSSGSHSSTGSFSGGGGGGGWGWKRKEGSTTSLNSPSESNTISPRMSTSSARTLDVEKVRPTTQGSYSESILSGASSGTDGTASLPASPKRNGKRPGSSSSSNSSKTAPTSNIDSVLAEEAESAASAWKENGSHSAKPE